MNKTYQELCDEVATLREQLADSQTSLEQALEIGEEANAVAQDRAAMVGQLARNLGVDDEPLETRDLRLIQAAGKGAEQS